MATLSPAQARERQRAGTRLIDIRGDAERALGMAEGVEALLLDDLLAAPDAHLTRNEAVLLICQRGLRSERAMQALHAQGFNEVISVEGGTEAWQAAQLPMAEPADDADFLERYSRQIRLPQIGIEGQRKLRDATVLLVGAGGLGAPSSLYLAAAGVGRLRIVDHDRVDRSNLQRQVVHAEATIGHAKVESARERLLALNPHIVIEAMDAKVDASNVDALLEGCDIVLDGADNFAVREVLNAACVRHGLPMVYAAVQGFTGQLSMFDAANGAPCYRCLFPDMPSDAPNCAEMGVLGVVPGILGMLQANEVLKHLLGIGDSLAGRLVQFDALTMRFRETRVPRDPHCPVCGSAQER